MAATNCDPQLSALYLRIDPMISCIVIVMYTEKNEKLHLKSSPLCNSNRSRKEQREHKRVIPDQLGFFLYKCNLYKEDFFFFENDG